MAMTSSTSSSPAIAAGSEPGVLREGGMRADAPGRAQLGRELAPEREVGGVVAVEVADLALAEPERELAPLALDGRDAGPRGDLGRDLLAR